MEVGGSMKTDSFWGSSSATRLESNRTAALGKGVQRMSKLMNTRLLAFTFGIASVLLLVLLAPTTLMAQISTGGVTGTVKDSAGAVIPDATVTLTNTATGVQQTSRTTATGAYNFTVVPYGNYTLLVQHPGFQDVSITGFDVHVQVI